MPFFGYARQDRKDQPRVPVNGQTGGQFACGVRGESPADDGFAARNKFRAFLIFRWIHLIAAPVIVKYLPRKEFSQACDCRAGYRRAEDGARLREHVKCGTGHCGQATQECDRYRDVPIMVGEIEGCQAILVET